MLTLYEVTADGLVPQEGEPRLTETAVWLDLLTPTPGEVKGVEEALHLNVPTREEQREIEVSSRLYKEDGAHFMTATLLYQGHHPQPTTTTATFILSGNRLVTLRYADPRAFQLCVAWTKRAQEPAGDGIAVLTLLLEAVIDRTADAIERIQTDVDQLSHQIFEVRGSVSSRQRRLDELLRSVGQLGDLSSKARDSVHSLGRLLTFFAFVANERKVDKALKARIRTAARDVESLSEHVNFMSNKIVFLLDAVLGMITIEQNNITKIFSIVAVVFLPPTLIASIYGMNFHDMPEINSPFGYPVALFFMVIFAVLPYLYWKRKGWL